MLQLTGRGGVWPYVVRIFWAKKRKLSMNWLNLDLESLGVFVEDNKIGKFKVKKGYDWGRKVGPPLKCQNIRCIFGIDRERIGV